MIELKMNSSELTTSIVIPVKEESKSLDYLFERLIPILEKLPTKYELVFVNDGSKDNTLELLIQRQQQISQIKIIDLSRNFGQEAAIYAGIENCSGDAVVSIDADLQDPPELILEMVNYWLEGYEVVTAARKKRETDTFFKRKTAELFYKSIETISDTKMVPNAGNYRLLNKAAMKAFLSLEEKVRFNRGIIAWIGFKEKVLYHDRSKRSAGTSNYNFIKMLKFSIDGITSFSKVPLELWSYIGIITALSSFLYGALIVIKALFFGGYVSGYPSLITFLLFFSGLQMMGIGMLGSYIGRILIETKRRPLYIARKVYENKGQSIEKES